MELIHEIHKYEAEQVLNWYRGRPFTPVSIALSMTDKCNLACKFCFFSKENHRVDPKMEMNEETFLRIVKEGLELGIKEWTLMGGEPLFNPGKFLKTMELIKQHKHQTHGNMNTNGILFTDELIKRAVELGWDEITFSIDSPDAEVHDFLRSQKGAFARTTAVMRKFQETKKRMGKHKPYINIHTIITNRNHTVLEKVIELGRELGVTNVDFTHLFNETENYDLLKLSQEQNEQANESLAKAVELAEKYGITTNAVGHIKWKLAPPDQKQNRQEEAKEAKGTKETKEGHDRIIEEHSQLFATCCFEPMYKLSVLSHGHSSCCRKFLEDGSQQDDIKTKSVSEVWHGERLNKIRDAVFNGSIPDKCMNCASSASVINNKVKEELKRLIEEGK